MTSSKDGYTRSNMRKYVMEQLSILAFFGILRILSEPRAGDSVQVNTQKTQ